MEDPIAVADFYGDSPWATLAHKHWLAPSKPVGRAQPAVIKEIWESLEKERFAPASVQTLESLQILERYLWPSFNAEVSNQHVLLIAIILSAKSSSSTTTWSLFDRPADFSIFFRRLLSLSLDFSLSSHIRVQILTTLVSAFQSLDSGIIRKECAPLVSIGIWNNLHNDAARNTFLENFPQFKKAWKAATKRYESADQDTQSRMRFERGWLYTLILDFLDICYNEMRRSSEDVIYCERFMELLTDLQSQFPTRRYVNTLLRNLNLLVLVRQSPLYRDEDSALFRNFYVLLRHYTAFPLDDQSGQQLSREAANEQHTSRLAHLQRVGQKHFPDKLKLLALANYGSLQKRDELSSHLESLTDAELRALVTSLGYRADYVAGEKISAGRPFLLELLLSAHEKQISFQDSIHDTALLPTEQSLYEASFLRNESYNGSRPLAIPKINLQYLSTGDFLWRSFILSRCEAFYQIRKDLEGVVKRLDPRQDIASGELRFRGSSNLACQASKPAIVEVVAPRVGEILPASVRAEISLDISRMSHNIRLEWESLRQDDVVFLLSVKAKDESKLLTNGSGVGADAPAAPFTYLRCAEIIHVLDDNGRPIRQKKDQMNGYGRPRSRKLLVKLDSAAYQEDMRRKERGKTDIYDSINVVVRRRSRENNFKPKLESIRKMTLSDMPLPSWMQDVFLGLGDPAGASYKNLPNAMKSVDFRDTFLDWTHLCESFQSAVIKTTDDKPISPPYVLTVSEQQPLAPEEPSKQATRSSKKRKRDEPDRTAPSEAIEVSTYKPPNMGPYPTDAPKTNTIRFTAAQTEAVRSGTQPGLTVIVGPPGTGKTDVATQIINNIYHNYPQERTLLIAHSNQALNQLFRKIAALDIDERHLLRLGHGEGELQLDNDASYSKHGRVDSFLALGQRHLDQVSRLAASIDAPGAHGSSCETADYFNLVYVKPAWTRFLEQAQSDEATSTRIMECFPFTAYFSNAPQPLFPPDATKEEAFETAQGCYRHIERIFSELEDIRPFEILRSDRTKANYLLIKEARIIAMTSTHAAIRRQEIVDLGFQYDNVVMEEAAQVTEIENFIPLALQQTPKHRSSSTSAASQSQYSGLKRVILCGDHLQNSPIIENLAFRQYANLSQSLFERLVRLGVPVTQLDAQGRARPTIASLYSWRYTKLENLPHTSTSPEFVTANAGFAHPYQFIDVPDYKGKGESEPTPHFLQNLGEAEYAVALFMYMRLLGYPASKISILTMYAGQRALIRDVLSHRCKNNRLFGMPRAVSTVDRFQGEQSDYVIMSLVRTARVGYLRDIRRLTVALSRARLGLYILGRRSVLRAIPELQPALERLLFPEGVQRSDKLELVTGEMYPAQRKEGDEIEGSRKAQMEGVEHLGMYVHEMTNAKIKNLREGAETMPVEEKPQPVEGEEEYDEDVEQADGDGGMDGAENMEEALDQAADAGEDDEVQNVIGAG